MFSVLLYKLTEQHRQGVIKFGVPLVATRHRLRAVRRHHAAVVNASFTDRPKHARRGKLDGVALDIVDEVRRLHNPLAVGFRHAVVFRQTNIRIGNRAVIQHTPYQTFARRSGIAVGKQGDTAIVLEIIII